MVTSTFITLLLVGMVGVFNASQVAIINIRRNRLEDEVERGSYGAQRAITLLDRQVELARGARLVVASLSVATALIAGTSWVSYLMEVCSVGSGFGLFAVNVGVVIALSLLLVVVGDLLPSSIASRYPEGVARILSPVISILVGPLLPLAAFADRGVVLLLGRSKSEPVSDEDVEEDIRDLVDEGERAGVIEPEEREIIDRVFKLDDKAIVTLMTPRADVVFLKSETNIDEAIRTAAQAQHTWFPVLGDVEDDVVGIVSLHDLILLKDDRERFKNGIRDILVEPLDVPTSINALKLLESFKDSGTRFAIVRDEYGGIAGIVTIYDVLDVMAGDVGDHVAPEERLVIRREDGSFLIDASGDVREVFEELGIPDQSPFNGAEFHSVGGYIMTTLGYVPREGERFEALGYTFEVVDMDGKRIDKVLISPLEQKRVVGAA